MGKSSNVEGDAVVKLAKSRAFTDASGSYDGRCRYSRRIPNLFTPVRNESWTCNITRLTTFGVGGGGSMPVGGSGDTSLNLRGRQ